MSIFSDRKLKETISKLYLLSNKIGKFKKFRINLFFILLLFDILSISNYKQNNFEIQI